MLALLAACGRQDSASHATDVTGALPALDFSLTRANDGREVRGADYRGKVAILYFGYTHCPDICPTTLATFKQAWALLGRAGIQDKVRFDFISVDPARDTPEQLERYIGFFSKDFVAATGSDDELTRLTRALGLVYSREQSADRNYAVDHSAAAVIIDPAGHEAGLFQPPFDAGKIAADLQTLAASR